MLGYAASTNFAITLASLANGSSRQSTPIDWSTYKQDDCQITLSLGITTPTSSNQKTAYIWFYGAADGTNFSGQAVGSDSPITIGTNHNLAGPFSVGVLVGTLQYQICIGSVAQYFGGIIPRKWGIIIENEAGAVFASTESLFLKNFTPVFITT